MQHCNCAIFMLSLHYLCVVAWMFNIQAQNYSLDLALMYVQLNINTFEYVCYPRCNKHTLTEPNGVHLVKPLEIWRLKY